LYRSQARTGEAVAIYEDFLRANPADVQIRFELGNTLMKSEHYAAAAEEFEKILQWDNSLIEAKFSLGLAYFLGREKYDEAIAAFLELLRVQPDNNKAIYFLASAYEKKGQYEDALKELETISEESDLYIASRVKMGFILQTQNRIHEAIELITAEIEKKGATLELSGFLAVLYEEEGMLEEAERVLIQGLAVSPRNVDLHYRLGVIYGKENKHEKSIEAMKALLEIDPDNADALNFIGYSYAERGVKLDEAETLIRKAIRIKPDNGYIMDSLGWVYFQQDRLEEAIDCLRKAVDLLPQDPTIAGHLGDAYKKAGQIEKALDVYREALQRNPGSSELEERIRSIRISGE
jgi:tetratricopeptide (TPR) repeat protein